MNRVDIIERFIILVLFGVATGSARAENPTITKHRVFSIPFFIGAQTTVPGEVQLYVSGNQGKSWKLYQRRSPKTLKFDFQAGDDGEYWFVVGTDRNRFVPQEGTTPDKIVIVDNRQPQIELDLESTSNGRMRASWRCFDPSLDARSFRLSYRTTSSQNWKKLEVVLPDQLQSDFAGEASWMVEDLTGMVDVTAQIMDRAGNEALITRSLSVNQPSAPVDQPKRNEDRPSTSFVSARTATRTHPQEDHEQFGVWTSENNEFDSSPLPWRNPVAPTTPSDRLDPTLPLTSFKESFREPELPDPLGFSQDSRQDQLSGEPSNDGPANDDAILFSNSRQFQLEYDIAEMDGELERVELWITQDGGNVWEPYGVDEDLVSPILVEVESEGQFGFRMLLHSKNGRSNRPPQTSDKPDVLIEVDTTRPDAAIRTAEYRAEPSGNKLILNWEANDRNLPKQPIILSYSNSVHGPWVIFARDVENTGHYEWTPNVTLPESFFVQLDMQDKAGNRVVHRFPQALSLNAATQKAKVRFLQVVPQ